MTISPIILLRIILLTISFTVVGSLHLEGQWKSSDFFKFLSKFGFQQTDLNDRENTQGYVYGNITFPGNITTPLTFLVVDKQYFIEYYGNRTVLPRTSACQAMFEKIDKFAWNPVCNDLGREDFIRKVPCPTGQLCAEEDKPSLVVNGYQFTYRIQDTSQPRFWYIALSSCYRNTTNKQCQWYHNIDQDITLSYDIWLVNGSPYNKHINPFEHQFSFEMHDVFEIYAVFMIVCFILLGIQVWALRKQYHAITKILTFCIFMEFIGILLNFIHVSKFAYDGKGVVPIRITGNVIDMIAECIFMLLLMLIAKGWTITQPIVTRPYVLRIIWVCYTLSNGFLFVWNLTEIDIISDIDEWQTWPGFLILAFRMVIMLWFLYELRTSFTLEKHSEKLRFYLHFGAGFLVWFIYLPITALVGTAISPLWRYKALLSITFGADILAFVILCHLLWPSRSAIYFDLEAKRNGIMRATNETENIEMTGLLMSDDEDNVFDMEATNLIKTTRLRSSSTSSTERVRVKPYTDSLSPKEIIDLTSPVSYSDESQRAIISTNTSNHDFVSTRPDKKTALNIKQTNNDNEYTKGGRDDTNVNAYHDSVNKLF